MPEHRGLTYTVEREENERASLGYAHEFVLYVDGERVITATELETRRLNNSPESGGDNWTNQLTRCAQAYIDGLEAGLNDDHGLNDEDAEEDQ